MLARSMPWELPGWTLPETTYLSSDGFGGEWSGLQRRSPGTHVNVKPRQLRKRPMTRRSVKSSTRNCCSGWLVRFRNGAMATAMLGRSHGHCGCDFRGLRDRWAACLVALPSSVISPMPSPLMSCAHLILVKRQNRRSLRGVLFCFRAFALCKRKSQARRICSKSATGRSTPEPTSPARPLHRPKQQFLNFLPLRQGQGSFLPTPLSGLR